jgi:hypothetical protein
MFVNLPAGNNASGSKLPEHDTPLQYSINSLLQTVAPQARSVSWRDYVRTKFPSVFNGMITVCNYMIVERQNPLVLPLQKAPQLGTHPWTWHEGPEGEYRYRPRVALSLTSTLDGGGRPTPTPGLFTPWKETRYPFSRKLDGPQGWYGRVRKSRPHRVSIPRPSSP